MLVCFGLLFPALHSWSVPNFSTLQDLLLASESLEVEVQVKSGAVAVVQLQQPEQFEPMKGNTSGYTYTSICNSWTKKQESHNSCSPRIPTCNTPNKELIHGMQLLLSNLNCCSQKNILHSKNSFSLNRQIYVQLTCHSESPLKSTESPYKSRPQRPPAPEQKGATSFTHHCCSTPRLPWARPWVQSHATHHWHPSLSRLSSLSSTQQAHRINTLCSYHQWWIRFIHL